jgi:GAF domain-containing protein
MTAIAERRLEHLLKGLPPERQVEILAALHNEIAQERQRRVESDALRAMTAAVAARDRLAEGAAEFLDHLSRLVRARGCAVALAEPGGRFRVVAWRSFAEPALSPSGPFTNVLTERLARGRVPMPLPEADVTRRQGRAGPARVSGWAIPLLIDDELCGVVTIRRAQADPFTHDHLRLAQGAVTAAARGLILLQRLEQLRRVSRCPIEASSGDAGEDPGRGRSPQRLRRLPPKSERGRQGGLLRRHDRAHP